MRGRGRCTPSSASDSNLAFQLRVPLVSISQVKATGTDKFKFLLFRIKGNVQSLDVFFVLVSPLVQLSHRHLFGCALLLKLMDLSSESTNFLVQ
jgi:hypothetical protein